ncbi:MAG: nickel/cobalt efflux transporter [Pseudomonadota bacterium]
MNLTEMIEAGSVNPLLLFAFALVLGALHGLEPGHSKTMMAAYIVAIKGSVSQAVLLGASAAFSHSIIVWVLAMIALTYGNELIGERLEPWFIMISGVLVLGIAVWMLRAGVAKPEPHHHHHDQDHGHDHHHGEGLDAHARAHAVEIEARVGAGQIGTWQTVLFGLSGGLIPCPAAITVFILCLHLGKVTLGVTLVSAFSIGLALTLIGIGVVTAIGLKAISGRSSRFDRVFKAAPWISAVLIACVGIAIIWTGYSHLGGHGHVH